MKAVVTAIEMSQLDKLAINELGIPGVVLMENAGRGIAEIVLEELGNSAGKCVHIFCGPGNNGGDGFVVARYLISQGVNVSLFLLADPVKITGDAMIHFKILCKIGCDPLVIRTAADLPIERPHLIVDALLGTGVRGDLRALYTRTVEHINSQKTRVVAVDIPTGVNADTGAVVGEAVHTDITATMALLKRGLLFSPGREYCGELKIVDISLPPSLVEKHHPQVFWIERADVRNMLPRRASNAHKNQCGQVLLVAGSRGFTGAAALAAESSLRAGAGLAYLASPLDLNAVYETKLTEVITVPTGDNDGFLTDASLPTIVDQSYGKTAIIVGPGLGRRPQTEALVRGLLQQLDKHLLLDADGLNACAGQTHLLSEYRGALILTPHVGELARLTGLSAQEISDNPVEIARHFAREWRCVLVLKGGPTVTAASDGRVYINSSGNAGMATAGAGDVLAGVIAGLLAQGLDAATASIVGVYVHGLSGDFAATSLGQLGMIAGDLLRLVPHALKSLGAEMG